MSGSPSDPEDSLGPVGLLVEQIVQKAARGDARLNVVELDDDTIEDGWTLDEQAYDADILKIESESVDLTQDDEEEEISRPFLGGAQSDTSFRCEHYIKGARNPCICGHHDQENDYLLGDTKVRKNNVHGLKIELRVGRFLVDFIEIKEIWVHRITGAVLVRGFAYTRTRNLDGRLQAYKNEVCRLVEIDTNDDRPVEEQSLIELTLEDLHPTSRVLHITNKSFPECRFDPKVYNTNEDREMLAPLTARWTHIMQYPDKRFRRAQRPIDGETLAHLMEDDVPKARHRDIDSERLRKWRGDTMKGGSYVSQNIDENVSTPNGKTLPFPKHRYNAADMFSGAGGYTAGAKRAGIKVVYALDHWARCNATYKANHPEVELQQQDIMTYCNDLTLPDIRFDLVHLSPPCQTWSPAHTCAGKNDSANIAALYACTDIIFRFRPRIVTFEQTFGIIQERHLPWFNALVQSLTKHGYSLTWKVIRLVEYGLAQTRKRLIMIGAAPGEKLPSFPNPTHAAEPNPLDGHNHQKRFVSAIKACWGLVPGLNLHDPAGVKQMQRQPWDGKSPMNRTITTSGGQAYHWDGERDLTLAEFARLQGFPDDYIFQAPCIKKQIGNAFPPTVVHAIMKQIIQSLEQADNINSAPKEEDVIHITDDDDGDDGTNDDERKYHSGNDCAALPKYEREPEPDYYGYPGYFQDINYGLSEEEAIMAAMEESRQTAAPHDEGIDLFGDGFHSAYSDPTDNAAFGFQRMTAEERTACSSQISQGGIIPRMSSHHRHRRSSGGSSVVCTGQRKLPTITEDAEDHTGEGSSAAFRASCADSWPPSSSDTYVAEGGGVQAGSSAATSSFQDLEELACPELDYYEREDDLALLAPASPPSSPKSGASYGPLYNIFGTVPSQWSNLRAQAQSSTTHQTMPCSASSVTGPYMDDSGWQQASSFDTSKWQESLDEDDALARAMQMSIDEAVQRHEEATKEAETYSEHVTEPGAGLDVAGIGGSFNPFGPLAPDQTPEDTEEEAYEGKGKGKACESKGKEKATVKKRSFNGADTDDAGSGSPPKKGRTQE